MPPERLSLGEARRVALAAQGFDRPRPRRAVTIRDLRRAILQLGLLQIDYVNVLGPAQYQVLFSRVGPYRRSLLDELTFGRREFTEQWAHEASIIPVSTWPLLRHRMETHRPRPYGFDSFLALNADYAGMVLNQIRERGPLSAASLPPPENAARVLEHSWFSSVPRAVLEAHFGKGLLAVSRRLPNFAREFDLAERILPEQHYRRALTREEAQRELLKLAARSYGIGTAADLADYYRMPVREARPRLDELIESGDLRPAQVEGWRQPGYLYPGAKLPARIECSALLSPFDPVLWYRPRAKRLFDFDYRVEIFFPEAQRKWGYYVLPFLFGDRLVARADLKADRVNERLLVLSASVEHGADPAAVAGELASELHALASWYGLQAVAILGKNPFARRLRRAAAEFAATRETGR